MMFSSTPFLFDPKTGFTGTDVTLPGVIDAEHGASAAPEPGTLGYLGLGFILMSSGLVALGRKKPSPRPKFRR
jgi:hypothetical protein